MAGLAGVLDAVAMDEKARSAEYFRPVHRRQAHNKRPLGGVCVGVSDLVEAGRYWPDIMDINQFRIVLPCAMPTVASPQSKPVMIDLAARDPVAPTHRGANAPQTRVLDEPKVGPIKLYGRISMPFAGSPELDACADHIFCCVCS